jgi:hypothetical protein
MEGERERKREKEREREKPQSGEGWEKIDKLAHGEYGSAY